MDFSRDILSLVCGAVKIKAYPHRTYWEDVGSLKDYYAANMALARGVSNHFTGAAFSIVTEVLTMVTLVTHGTLVYKECLGSSCCRSYVMQSYTLLTKTTTQPCAASKQQ